MGERGAHVQCSTSGVPPGVDDLEQDDDSCSATGGHGALPMVSDVPLQEESAASLAERSCLTVPLAISIEEDEQPSVKESAADGGLPDEIYGVSVDPELAAMLLRVKRQSDQQHALEHSEHGAAELVD